MQLRNFSRQSRNSAESPNHRVLLTMRGRVYTFMASHEVRIPEEEELEEKGWFYNKII